MAQLSCQFVRPDKLIYNGYVASLILATQDGELGVWPGHASAIVSLGDGVVRLHHLEDDGGETDKVVVSGGYAEINPNGVIILASHARLVDDIERDVVLETRQEAFDKLNEIDEKDNRRAYYQKKVAWCNMLLREEQHAREEEGVR